jgi:hypothetical protein
VIQVTVSWQDIQDAEETPARTSAGTDSTEGLFNMVSIPVNESSHERFIISECRKRQLMSSHFFKALG